ncbi:FAD-dependent tricarballylate dehydrogenase TcuA [Acidocella sp. KAb 2-4]|uniref:FAD-dependent tricarballylate dehydrogenase TcuA n=1 Tax=Acidocella sp. KAb 2-4 TaxID=2885158 RepID=UPI001D07217E|nr:FAD-dependent tricarballylate dehydrogenase TcuA [Acidocella sp. KAb 2-4]MCB5944244.1 FAD-dependent tricarballylate dehydrogenase TcuA [Acidocella sp. KAb 2-4]
MKQYDVIVIGAGNAALCAAVSAAEQGARVLVLERAPIDERGGNSAYSGGAIRVAYRDVEDLRAIMPDLSEDEIASTDFGIYDEDQFFDDLAKLSHYRMNQDLVSAVVWRSRETMLWMRGHGVRFVPIYGRQAYKIDGRFKFWGGLTVEAVGGGQGLVDSLFRAAEKMGVEIMYGARAMRLVRDDLTVSGVEVVHEQRSVQIHAGAVILASGGFHANAEWRARYLGPNWDLAKPRASRFNTGDGIRMALDIGAMSYGHWSGCHSVAYERNAPEFGEPGVLGLQKNSFPMGIMINARGERFFDEGADFRNYIYADLGRAILAQPDGIAWQIFDQHTAHLLSDEYRMKQITKVQADTLEELAEKMGDVDRRGFHDYIGRYNASVRTEVPFNPNIKDGRGTTGLAVPKTNWANPLSKPPYLAFGVTCGITFTYGGLRINEDAQVLDEEQAPIPGLYATGELVGGLYYGGYAGGAGLMSGAVFGRIAGGHAARRGK